jgi:autotransporter-associated beta strand protein
VCKTALFVSLALCAVAALAAPKTWDGGAGTGNWADAANWNPDGVPGSSDAVLLDNSSQALVQQISALGNASAATLLVDGGTTTATFLNYAGATPLALNLFGASVNASATGPLLGIAAKAPAALTVNKVEFRLRASGELLVEDGHSLTLSNCYVTESGGSFGLTKTGAGTLRYSGSGPKMTFTGGLGIAGGLLDASATSSCLPVKGVVTFSNPSGVSATILSSNSHSIEALAGGNQDSLIVVSGTTGLTLTGQQNTVFDGIIDDNGDRPTRLTYAGGGSLTLTQAHTYTGPTTIRSGRLALGANGTLESAAIQVEAGGVLDVRAWTAKGGAMLASGVRLSGNGRILGGLLAGAGSTVAPGVPAGSVGPLSFADGFSLGTGAHLALSITSAGNSQLLVTGGEVVLAGDVAGSEGDPAVKAGDVFFLLRNTGAGATRGTLAGAGDGGKLVIAGQSYRLSLSSSFGGAGFQVGGGGKDVALQAFDDPSPTALGYRYEGSFTQPGALKVVLDWQQRGGGSTGFAIWRGVEGGAPVQIGTVGASVSTFTDTEPPLTAALVYRVEALGPVGLVGDPALIEVPRAVMTVEERKQAVVAALARVSWQGGDLKDAFPYVLARLLGAAPGSVDLGAAQARALALLVANSVASNGGNATDPFRIHSAMHGYLVAKDLYTARMVAETKRVVQLPDYDMDANYVSENFFFMYNGSGFLACEQWPDFTDAGGKSGAALKAGFRAQLLKAFARIVSTNLWEHGSPTYYNTDLAPIRMVAEFAQDPELKLKARATLDWLMLNLACDWNQGYYTTAAGRCKDWSAVSASPDNFGTTSGVGWMYFGGFRPAAFNGGEIFHAFWMAYRGTYETPALFQRFASERFSSFSHRSVAWYGGNAADYKYTWHTPDYSLASQYIFSSASTSMAKEQLPVVFKWLSDKPESTLIVNLENHAGFYYGGSIGLSHPPYTPVRNRMGYGTNPYAQHFQHRQTLVGVANVSPWYANENGAASDGTGLDPLYFAELYVPVTKKGAIRKMIDDTASGWVYFHGGSTLFALWTHAPHYWGGDVSGCSMLRSKALKNAWILETASASEYPAASLDGQLDAFKADILARGAINASEVESALPRLRYQSVHGYTLDLTYRPHQTDDFWTVAPRFPAAKDWPAGAYVYTDQAKVNGVAVAYDRASWPLLENPWVYQAPKGELVLSIGGVTRRVDYATWTTSESSAPAGGYGSRIINLSVRCRSAGSSETMIAGFVLSAGRKPVLIRGIGPGLAPYGVASTLSDPRLNLFNSARLSIATNDNWGSSAAAGQISWVSAQTGAFALPAGSSDAAMLQSLDGGLYSAHLTAGDARPGNGLIELYDAETSGEARLVNISGRAKVGTGEDILVAGFVLSGQGVRTVLIRGVGPGLASQGLTGLLADPQLTLFDSLGQVLAGNDDWGSAGDVAQLAAAAQRTGAFALSTASKDAALLVALPAGAYTAQITGVDQSTGIALVEVYEAGEGKEEPSGK